MQIPAHVSLSKSITWCLLCMFWKTRLLCASSSLHLQCCDLYCHWGLMMVRFGGNWFRSGLEWLITWQLQGNYINTKHLWTVTMYNNNARKKSFPVCSRKKLQPREFLSMKKCFLCFLLFLSLALSRTFTSLLLFVVFFLSFLQRQLVKFAVLSDTPVALSYFLQFCFIGPDLVLHFHPSVNRVSGVEKVGWNGSWLKKPVLRLDGWLHEARVRLTWASMCGWFCVAMVTRLKGTNLI